MRKPSGILDDTSMADNKKELDAAREALEKAKLRFAEAQLKNPAPQPKGQAE